jgi:AraC-like DNA-binding protein
MFYTQQTATVTNDSLMPERLNPDHTEMKRPHVIARDLFARIKESKEYIDKNAHQVLHIKAMAEMAYMSEFHFLRTFKEFYGVSPYQYYLRRKLDIAVDLLQSTSLPITTIAYDIGFKDVNSFSRFFKKVMKKSASAHRENNEVVKKTNWAR